MRTILILVLCAPACVGAPLPPRAPVVLDGYVLFVIDHTSADFAGSQQRHAYWGTVYIEIGHPEVYVHVDLMGTTRIIHAGQHVSREELRALHAANRLNQPCQIVIERGRYGQRTAVEIILGVDP